MLMTLLEPVMPIVEGDSATPMMAQYFDIKRAHPDCLLFYRMGDFYEMFFDDAVAAARALDIALTKRGRHEGRDIPMCGVPVATAESYLARLIKLGFRVAVAEQMEDPAEAKRRGPKSLVRRDVVRVVTPGTLTEDSLLEPRRNNYLAALTEAEGQLGLAWLDISTGEFRTQPVGADGLNLALARLEPGELLLPERLFARPDLRGAVKDFAGLPLPDSRFDSENGRKRLAAYYKVQALDGFGDFTRAEVAAAGALLDYLALTQKGRLPRLAPPMRLAAGAAMEIDPATARNLELFRTLSGERKGSLIATIDKTVTAAGARLLASRLALPLTDVSQIRARLDMVGYFFVESDLRGVIRELLGETPDIERALSRLSLFRGSPRDLANVRDALSASQQLRAILESSRAALSAELVVCGENLGQHDTLIETLSRALAPDLPVIAREGGFIAAGYSPALDEQRSLRDESRRLVAGLQSRYQTATGISSLKIRHNNVLGFYIEVPPGQAAKMPQAPFIHRQTLASAVRYTTTELADLESRIARAAETALGLELELFAELTAQVLANSDPITRAARALAELDVASALADLAVSSRYVRPAIDESTNFIISGGRHPVVESSLAANNDSPFVANDCALSAEDGNVEEGVAPRIWLLTGPNMAGKSTFLRQNALIAILAQIGSFVPAQEAKIGIVDRLFSRVGAADDLARGRSTFMVEMLETAAILNQAGPRALVILDEIGRGTATFDGLSIAWAVVEHLHGVNRCRALFATHYHELTALSATLPALGLYTMRVKEWQGQVVFLHEVAKGAADRSYGIHVAELAGLPPPVIARAGQVLESLERGRKAQALASLADDLPLFSNPAEEEAPNPATEMLDSVNPDALSPREALELLYKLKAALAASSKH
jgi:DNA mismatch repair protein MutS